MCIKLWSWLGCMGVLVAFSFSATLAQTTTSTQIATSPENMWTFDDYAVGSPPDSWQEGADLKAGASRAWQIVTTADAPSGAQVLEMSRPDTGGIFGLFGRAFNTIWTDSVSFGDGEIVVSFKAISGHSDQGGGIMWRVQDRNNYYVARYNPLEDNFLIYFVRNGSRQELVGTSIALSPDDWHSMKIVQRGNEFDGYLDGEKLLHGSSNLFQEAGGVGLWTKADAVTQFDDLVVRAAE